MKNQRHLTLRGVPFFVGGVIDGNEHDAPEGSRPSATNFILAAGRKPSGYNLGTGKRSGNSFLHYRQHAIFMYSQPLAYFLTWTCYGTWLPGDDRGWTKWQGGEVIPQPLLADWCRERMNESPVILGSTQRKIVHDTIKRHCELRSWKLHAVNCRSNHCHVVVTANSHHGEQVRDQFKSWCSRTLSASANLQNMASYRD